MSKSSDSKNIGACFKRMESLKKTLASVEKTLEMVRTEYEKAKEQYEAAIQAEHDRISVARAVVAPDFHAKQMAMFDARDRMRQEDEAAAAAETGTITAYEDGDHHQ